MKKTKRKQVVWGPPSVAKHIGRNWDTMSTGERNLLADAVTFCRWQHDVIVRRHDQARYDSVVKVEQQRQTYRARLANLRATIRRQAERWRHR